MRMKSYVAELSRVYDALFEDALYAYPTLVEEFSRDRARLHRMVEQRGLSVYTDDLPALGKHFDRCLSNGEYKLSGLPLSKRYSNRVVIPKFLRGLYLLVFDHSGTLKEDYDVQAVSFLRQFFGMGGKTTVPCSDHAVALEVQSFVEVDSSLPEPKGFWKLESVSPRTVQQSFRRLFGSKFGTGAYMSLRETCSHGEASTLLRTLDTVYGVLTTTLGQYDWREWQFRHGPGVVSDRPRESNKSVWSSWSERLETHYPLADCGFHNYASWAASAYDFAEGEPTAKLVAVPKTRRKPRLIAAEPSSHQWCQQNLRHYFYDRVEQTWISDFVRFRDQTLNQELALEGSRDGSLCTLDLSAASDRVPCDLVGYAFRHVPSVVCALQSSRTRLITQDLTTKVDPVIALRKFSTMGNACTFPVESLLFLGAALTSLLCKRGLRPTLRNIQSLKGEVAVFGDDIIIAKDGWDSLVSLLEALHFKVNVDKSFSEGNFRESCGVDAFNGVCVTPARWRTPYKATPEVIATTIEVANNLYNRFLVNTSNAVAARCKLNICTVSADSGVFGLQSFCQPDVSNRKVRHNQALQIDEVLVPVPVGTVQVRQAEHDTALLQFFTEDPDPLHPWKAGVKQKPRLKIKSRWVPMRDITAQ